MKKLVIGGAIAAVLLVAAVWAGLEWFLVEKNESFEKPVASNAPVPVPPSKSNLYRENVQRFLDGIAKSFRKRDHGRIADQFDLTQLYLHALGHDRSPDPPLPKLIGSQHSQLYSAVMDSFVRGGFGLPWDRIQIEQFLETPKGELVVNVLQISGDRVIPVWWWLVPTKNGYLITDAEDRLLGLSVSNQFSMLLNSGMSEERSGQVAEAVKCIPEIERLLDKY